MDGVVASPSIDRIASVSAKDHIVVAIGSVDLITLKVGIANPHRVVALSARDDAIGRVIGCDSRILGLDLDSIERVIGAVVSARVGAVAVVSEALQALKKELILNGGASVLEDQGEVVSEFRQVDTDDILLIVIVAKLFDRQDGYRIGRRIRDCYVVGVVDVGKAVDRNGNDTACRDQSVRQRIGADFRA